jgi:hypothetical protein
MLFNSIDFAIFLPIVFIIYWSLQDRLKMQNFIVVIAIFMVGGIGAFYL